MSFRVRRVRPVSSWLITLGVSVLLALACAAGKPIEGSLSSPGDYVALRLTPPIVILNPNDSADFQATAELSDGTENPAIGAVFEATGGTIDNQGHYHAGPTAGDFRVIASLGGRADTSLVQISLLPSRTLTGISIAPPTTGLVPGGTQQFAATGVLSDGADSAITVDWTATGGTVSPTGLYTAPAQAGSYLVIATLQGGSLSDTARVTVGVLPPTLVAVVLTPATTSLQFGQTQQFVAVGQLNGGSTTSITITWAATGGTITTSGRYTAGNTSGTYRVIARAANGMADTSSVTVAAPTITSVTLTPATAALQTGQAQQFSVSASLSNGSTQTNPSVTYSVTGGTMTTGGLYTAGSTTGSFHVIATATGGAADTCAVTITTALITAIVVTPASATVTTGQTRQFTASATLSNGGTQPNPAVTWSATGGTISGSGLYTAGSTTGSFRVIAVQQSGTLADTSAVTVTTTVANGMFFNSAEPGCDGSDPNVVFCDDFEDGDWYSKDCDQANASGGLLQTDGWCGTIYANPISPAGAASCGNLGANGTNCAANGGRHSGQGGVNMGSHAFSGGPVTELYARWYYKTDPGYMWGAEKHTNFTKAAGDITWFNIQFNCGAGSASSTAQPSIQILHGTNVCAAMNVSSISLQSGRWYFFEAHAKLNSSGTTPDGLIELWINDCGTNGVCTGSPTLRTRMTNVAFDRNQSGCSTSPCKIEVLWFENWANPGSSGTGYYDQIKASKVGPIGFMP
jgi:hypothetical protein